MTCCLGLSFDKNNHLLNLIQKGELETYHEKTGRRYSIWPTIVHGKGLASLRGFPTANMLVRKFVTPPYGVYAVLVKVSGQYYKAAANLTNRCRVYTGKKENYLEVHILDFDKVIYGKKVEVVFHKWIRPPIKFSLEPKILKQQLHQQLPKDIENVREYFAPQEKSYEG